MKSWIGCAALLLLSWAGCSDPSSFCEDKNAAMTASGECWPIKGTEEEAVADDSATPQPEDSGLTMDTTGLERLQAVFPEAVGHYPLAIPASHNTENDLFYGNDEVSIVVEASGETIGLMRHIFTPVFCSAGVCEAIQFVMTFEPNGAQKSVYHPDDFKHPLMKYIDGYYLLFDEADMALLNEVFVSPPDVYVGVEDVEDLVEGSHGTAPTLPEYQPVTVRGAVFTIWYIIRYGQRTSALMATMGLTEGADGSR
jgi:hypothetical protein